MRIRLTLRTGGVVFIPVGGGVLQLSGDDRTDIHIGGLVWTVRETIDQIRELEAAAKAPPAEEAVWKDAFPTPWRIKEYGAESIVIVANNNCQFGQPVERDSRHGAAYRHIVKVVNEREAD